MSMQNNPNDEAIVEKAVKLSVVEVFLGTIIHATHLPLGGHLLSLNQGLFLCKFLEPAYSRSQNFKMLVEISIVTSAMKALSPAGKKLGPMISISSQGLFYSIGILVFGVNRVGQCFGMVLLSLWSFIQPFITYYIVFGSDFLGAVEYFLSKINSALFFDSQSIYLVVFSIVFFKILISLFVPFLSEKINFNSIQAKAMRLGSKPSLRHLTPVQGLVKDLTRPIFLLSFALMGSFFYFSGSSHSEVILKLLRAISIAAIIFYLSRSLHVKKVLGYLGERNLFIKRINRLSSIALERFFQSVSNLN